MCCRINRYLLLPDHSIHSKIHLIIHNRFSHSSHINDGFFILNLSEIHLNTNKHSIFTSSIQRHNINTYTMWLMCFSCRMKKQFFFFPLDNIDKFLFLYCRHHDGSSSRVNSYIFSLISMILPGTILLQPALPKHYSCVLVNLFNFSSYSSMISFPESLPSTTESLNV